MYFFHKFDFFSRPKVRPKPKHNRNTVSQKISGASHKREILPKKRDNGLKHSKYHCIRFFTALAEQRTPAVGRTHRGSKISINGVKQRIILVGSRTDLVERRTDLVG